MLKELCCSKNAEDYCGEMFSLPYKFPDIVDRTFAKPLILYNFSALHSNPGTLEPLNPHRITNSFGGDPNLKWRFVKRDINFA